MQDREENISTLVELGLNKTQARVYLALVEKGTLPIKLAADHSGVGRPDTYRAMLELNQRGLVETILCSPTKYRPLPLNEAINVLMGQKQQEIIDLKEKSKKLLHEYKKKIKNQMTDAEKQIVILSKGTSGIKKGIQAITTAQKSIEFITSVNRFNQLLFTASEDIVDATNRGVKIRFILDKESINRSLSKIFASFHETASFKYIADLPQPFIAIYDSKSILMETTDEDFYQSTMMWSNNPVIVRTIQNYFKLLWASNDPNIRTPIGDNLEFIKES
ncbi:MAG: TrmB family transcriptional regulator [Candidatus Bathyarchaeia archaeon]|jgi:sugar-specific transcriptional regulator TrmB